MPIAELSPVNGNGPMPAVIEERVLAIRCYPGLDYSALGRLVASEGLRGVVVELYPAGTGPTEGPESLAVLVRELTRAGIVVIGSVPDARQRPSHAYESTQELIAGGMQILHPMLHETAIVKLMLALGQGCDSDTTHALVRRSVCGEFAWDLEEEGGPHGYDIG
jgi:L-asparaginase